MFLDPSLFKIIDAADANDAEDIAIRRFLVAALHEGAQYPVLDQDSGLWDAPAARVATPMSYIHIVNPGSIATGK